MDEQQHRPSVYDGGTVGDMIVTLLDRFPDKTAFIDGARRFTYAETRDAISRTVQHLRALGLRKGDTVVQLSGNRPEVFFVTAALYLLGLRSVTLQAMGGIEDHAYILEHCDARMMLADGAYAERTLALRGRVPGVAHWYLHEAAGDLPGFWAEAARHTPAPLPSEATPDDIIRLAYTGGTTGRPKGVMLPGRATMTQTLLLMAGRAWSDAPRFLCPTPISHGAGATLIPVLWRGGTVILQKGFDPDRFLDAMEEHGATATFLVPTMVYKLLDHPRTRRTDFSGLETLMYGAAPMSPARIKEALGVFGPVLQQGYGQSEAPSAILTLSRLDHTDRDERILSSAGKPYPGITVRLLDERDEEVPQGEIGEICVRGPLAMAGYLKQPELTAEVLRNGWLHTGDMAYRDARGFFFIVDRKKDMVVSGGFNVFPKEVEDVLTAHPAVSAAAVIGVPDPRWGEAVKAIVVCRPGMAVSAAELAALVKERKGAVAAPKTVDFVESLPLTVLGKPDKKALRAPYWEGQARAVG
ncbi:AMP-binding protein [Roseomonas populi]|uniref:AMP-binding protein n=1 Tax=Roseomonas populi TaxID=3121582 RepID=A0ABT1XCJ5_9PROT|nr:AMP-binding protein [Roseomonas pecuniae]MCR0985664.1 AMP-binding protein [Roseomonas pecuniae]